jgi:hypothetical protein
VNDALLALAGIIYGTPEGDRLLNYLYVHPQGARDFVLDWHISGNLFWYWEGDKPVRIPPEKLSIDEKGNYSMKATQS